MDPRSYAMALEDVPQIPPGDDERVAGYAVTGVAFASGHVLAFQRIPALNVGPPHSALWLLDPEGAWTLYIDGDPGASIGRYVAPIVSDIRRTRIEVQWLGPWRLAINVPDAGLFWQVRFQKAFGARLAGFMFRSLPAWATRSRVGLRAAGTFSAPLLRTGIVGPTGHTPSGQRIRFVPRAAWPATGHVAMLRGVDLGTSGAWSNAARAGGIALPVLSLFVGGAAHVQPGATTTKRAVNTGAAVVDAHPRPVPSGA